MRHMPIAEFQDKVAETIAAARGGENIVITDGGRDVIRLVPVHDVEVDLESRREAFAKLAELRARMQARGARVTREEVKEWIAEGRR